MTIDRSRSPLLVVRFQGQTTQEGVDQYLAQMSEILATRQRFATLNDLREGVAGNNEVREKIAVWLKQNRPAIERLTVGSAFVVKSAMRSALSAVMIKQPIPGPYAIFADMDSAEAWLRQRFRESNLPLPPPPISAGETLAVQAANP